MSATKERPPGLVTGLCTANHPKFKLPSHSVSDQKVLTRGPLHAYRQLGLESSRGFSTHMTGAWTGKAGGAGTGQASLPMPVHTAGWPYSQRMVSGHVFHGAGFPRG